VYQKVGLIVKPFRDFAYFRPNFRVDLCGSLEVLTMRARRVLSGDIEAMGVPEVVDPTLKIVFISLNILTVTIKIHSAQ